MDWSAPLAIFRFNAHYASQLFKVAPEHWTAEAFPGSQTPHWLLGHLTIGTDYALRVLGLTTGLPAEWHARFGPGSRAVDMDGLIVEHQALWDGYIAGHARVEAALPKADPAVLDQPHQVPMRQLLKFVPRKADLLLHLLTSHEATHLGQMSTWRRQAGYPSIF